MPVYPPRGLVPGEYEMIGFNQANDAITARAGFTFVVQAATCDAPAPHQTVVDRQVCDENMRAFKVAAERMAERSRLVAALGLIGGRMLASGGMVVFGPLGGAIVSLTIAAGGFRVFSFPTGLHALKANRAFQQLADDPPDPNFAEVFEPQFSTEPVPPDPIDQAYFVASDRQAAYAEAVLRSYERFQGAQLAGDGVAAHAQIEAAAEYSTLLTESMADTADALRAIADRGAAAGGDSNPVVDAAYLAEVAALQQRVRDTGFTESEVAEMTAAGVEPDEIARACDAVGAYDLSPVTPGGTMAEKLQALATDIDNQIFEVNLFAAEAAARGRAPHRGGAACQHAADRRVHRDAGVRRGPLGCLFDASGSPTPKAPSSPRVGLR